MKNKYLPLYVLCYLLLILSCKKNTTVGHNGFRFFPFENNNRLLEYSISGFCKTGDKISFLYPTQSGLLIPDKQMDYDLNKQTTEILSFPNTNPAEKIFGGRCINSDQMVLRIQDRSHDTVVNGYHVYKEKIALMNAQHVITREIKINNASTAAYYVNENEIEVLSNGDIIVAYFYYNGIDTWIDLVYMDQNLKIKWRKQIERGPKLEYLNRGILEKNNHLYVLITPNTNAATGTFFRCLEFDTTGKLLHSVTQPLTGRVNLNILPADNGFKVFGTCYSIWEQKKMMASLDENCNIISTLYKDFSELVQPQEELYIGTFEHSNIVFKNSKYYFTHLYTSVGQSNTNVRNKLIIMNQGFGIEKIIPLEVSDMPKGQARYLTEYGDHFLSIAPTKWNNMTGLSFIETDGDGNIIQ